MDTPAHLSNATSTHKDEITTSYDLTATLSLLFGTMLVLMVNHSFIPITTVNASYHSSFVRPSSRLATLILLNSIFAHLLIHNTIRFHFTPFVISFSYCEQFTLSQLCSCFFSPHQVLLKLIGYISLSALGARCTISDIDCHSLFFITSACGFTVSAVAFAIISIRSFLSLR